MTTRKYSDATVASVCTLWGEGWTALSIMEALSISRRTVASIIARNRDKCTKRQAVRHSEETVASVCSMLAAGQKPNAIARALSMNHEAVWGIKRRNADRVARVSTPVFDPVMVKNMPEGPVSLPRLRFLESGVGA